MKRILFIIGLSIFFLASCGVDKERSENLVEEGIVLLYQSEFDEAKSVLTKAIKYNPENFEAYYYRGNCYANKRLYKDAINDFTSAIKYNANYAEAYANRGQMKFYLKDQEAACEDWKVAESLGMEIMSDKTRHCK